VHFRIVAREVPCNHSGLPFLGSCPTSVGARNKENAVVSPERRITPRFKLHTRLSFHRIGSLSEGEQQARSINISTRGVLFATNLAMSVGETVEVVLEIPKRVSGMNANIHRFTGRVAHIESTKVGTSFIGVQLLYYENNFAGTPGTA